MSRIYTGTKLGFINKRGQDPQANQAYAVSLDGYLESTETVLSKTWLATGVDSDEGPFIVNTDDTPVAVEDLSLTETDVDGNETTRLRCERVWLRSADYDGTTDEQDAWIGEVGVITLRFTTDYPRTDDVSFKLKCNRT